MAALQDIFPVLEVMEEIGMPLCVHGEMPAHLDIDPFYSEAKFLEVGLSEILKRFPKLRVSLEHVTTKEACDLVRSGSHENLVATVTPQHLHHDRRDLFRGGLRPYLYCLPILKGEKHRQAIQEAVLSGDPRFGLGTDSAPHLIADKLKDCGCAGVFSAPVALEAYTEFFAQNGALDMLQAFSSDNMCRFYGVSLPKRMVTLEYVEGGYVKTQDNHVGPYPFWTDRKMFWRIANIELH